MGCGSTIGPITATGIGVETVDVGVPTFAMHSIRELGGSDDAHNLYRVTRSFFGAAAEQADASKQAAGDARIATEAGQPTLTPADATASS